MLTTAVHLLNLVVSSHLATRVVLKGNATLLSCHYPMSPAERITCMCFDHDGQTLYVGTFGGRIILINSSTGAITSQASLSHADVALCFV